MTKKKKNPAPRVAHDKVAQEIKRLWGNLEVVDADEDLRVFVSPEDIACATPKDPGRCVFANACIRQFKAEKVLIFRSVAYVELPQKDGSRRVERFLLTPGMRDVIVNFDTDKPILPEAGFLLKAPTPSMRFENKRSREATRRHNERERERRTARIQGTFQKKGSQGQGRYEDEPFVRSGCGAVHFWKQADSD